MWQTSEGHLHREQARPEKLGWASVEFKLSSWMCAAPISARTVFGDRGEHELKGIPGTWRLFAVEG